MVTVGGGTGASDVHELRDWLIDGDVGLRGRIRMQPKPPAPGTLGAVLDALSIAVGPGGALTAVVALAVSWLRHRNADLELVITLSDGRSVRISAKRLRGLNARALAELVESYSAALGSSPGSEPVALPGARPGNGDEDGATA